MSFQKSFWVNNFLFLHSLFFSYWLGIHLKFKLSPFPLHTTKPKWEEDRKGRCDCASRHSKDFGPLDQTKGYSMAHFLRQHWYPSPNGHMICAALCKMKMQGPLLKSLKLQVSNNRALRQAQDPSKYRVLGDCIGCRSMKLALPSETAKHGPIEKLKSQSWIKILSLPLISYVIVGNLFHLSMFPRGCVIRIQLVRIKWDS